MIDCTLKDAVFGLPVAAEQVQQFSQLVPLGWSGQPEEIAGAPAFLASDLASDVTGEPIVLDGGWTRWQ